MRVKEEKRDVGRDMGYWRLACTRRALAAFGHGALPPGVADNVIAKCGTEDF